MGKFPHTVNEKLCQTSEEPVNFITVYVLDMGEAQLQFDQMCIFNCFPIAHFCLTRLSFVSIQYPVQSRQYVSPSSVQQTDGQITPIRMIMK
jgi:hypothetical protein